MDPATKQLKGIVPDFAQALGDELGLKIEWTQEIQIDQVPEALKSGRFDALCASDGPWVYSEAAFVDWTTPMAYFPVYLFGRKGETRFKTFDAINSSNTMFSSIDGDISTTIVLEKFPKAHRLEIPASADPSLVVHNVLTGKADLLIEDNLTVDRTNGNNGEKLEKIREEPFAIISMSFTTRKGDDELRQMLDQGFELLRARGISDSILDHYDPEHKLFFRPQKHWQQ